MSACKPCSSNTPSVFYSRPHKHTQTRHGSSSRWFGTSNHSCPIHWCLVEQRGYISWCGSNEGQGLVIKNHCNTAADTGKSDFWPSWRVISFYLSQTGCARENTGRRSTGFDPRGSPNMPDPLSSLACRALWFSHGAPACISLWLCSLCLLRSNSHSHPAISDAAAEASPEWDHKGGKQKQNPRMMIWSYLFSRGPSEDEGRKHREGVFGVCWPAFNCSPHRKAEERDRLRQGERLIIFLWVSAE